MQGRCHLEQIKVLKETVAFNIPVQSGSVPAPPGPYILKNFIT